MDNSNAVHDGVFTVKVPGAYYLQFYAMGPAAGAEYTRFLVVEDSLAVR